MSPPSSKDAATGGGNGGVEGHRLGLKAYRFRARVGRACERCRKLKIRCDENKPCCNCQKSNQRCVFGRDAAARAMAGGPGRAAAEPSTIIFHAIPKFSEAAQKLWAGTSCYASLSKTRSRSLSFLDSPRLRTGLPGTDDTPRDELRFAPDEFVHPSTCGFPDRETSLRLLKSYLESVHCIFKSVHAKLCTTLVEELFDHGMANVDQTNQAAHLAILALGSHAHRLIASPPGDTEADGSSTTGPEDVQLGETLYTQANLLIKQCMDYPTVTSVVALITLTLYQQSTRRFEAAWATFGLCIRHAHAIGLHREVPDWEISHRYKQGRREIWLTLYFVDTFLSICYGRPPAIVDDHCDIAMPQVYYDDTKLGLSDEAVSEQNDLSLPEICALPPSSGQFHLLKQHLCMIARKLLRAFYLDPTRGAPTLSNREVWDQLQVVMEDLHELGASIPEHLQVAYIDVQPDKAYQQQAIFLDLLINYLIILANRPVVDFEDRIDDLKGQGVVSNVVGTRQQLCIESLYNAASGICSLVTHGRHAILSPPIHLILSAWGVYTSAAELVTLQAMSVESDSRAAHEAYDNLNNLLRHATRLHEACPSASQEQVIIDGLFRTVQEKMRAEPPMVSTETVWELQTPPDILEPGVGQAPTDRTIPADGNSSVDASGRGHGLDISLISEADDPPWFDEFLAFTNEMTE